jgi:transposase
MNLSELFRLPKGVRLLRVTLQQPKTLWVEASACRGCSTCPSCRTPSAPVHSSYTRTVAAVPCSGRRVLLKLRVRTVRCPNDRCPQCVFTERFAGFVRPKARKTVRLGKHIRALGLALGGRGAELLASLLGIPATDQTIVRWIMADTTSSGTPLTRSPRPGRGRFRVPTG